MPPMRGEEGAVAAEEGTDSGEADAQQEEGKGDSQHEEEGVQHHPAPPVDGISVFFPFAAAREIADVDGDERDDAGGKEGEQPLQEDEEKADVFGGGKALHADSSQSVI